MTEYSGPFEDAGTGLTEAAWLNLEGNVYPYHGYIYGVLNELEVTEHAPTAAMSVDVGTGAGVINSSRYQNSALQTKTIDSVTPGKNRIDSIVLRRTIAAVSSTITIAVLKGTEAAPGAEAAPALTQVLGGVYELRLANILIASGTTAITTAMITDKRDSTDCGMFTPAVGPLAVDKATGNITTNGYDIDMSTSGQIHHLLDPTGDQDADTKKARATAITTALAAFVPTGVFLKRTYVASGTTNYTPATAGVKYFKVYVQGAGGNGGATLGSSHFGAIGGAAGGYLEKTFAGTSTSVIAYSVGAVGADSYVQSTIATYTATCATLSTAGSGSGGDFNLQGEAGYYGAASEYQVAGGSGGNSKFGSGGQPVGGNSLSNSNGYAATGYGSGGGGSYTFNSTAAKTGGAGAGGLVVIEEWG